MRLNRKEKAFTLSELLVTIVLSSIIIALAFFALTSVQRQTTSIQKNLNQQQKLQFLERLLWQDFNSFSVTFTKKTDILSFSNEIDTINYIFDNSYIIRESDTINLKINKELFLDGKSVDNGIVDALKINTLDGQYEGNTIFVFKRKDASFYMNQK